MCLLDLPYYQKVMHSLYCLMVKSYIMLMLMLVLMYLYILLLNHLEMQLQNLLINKFQDSHHWFDIDPNRLVFGF